MQTRRLAALLFVGTLVGSPAALASDGPLDDPPPAPAANFSGQHSPDFSPAAATAGTADASHATGAVDTHLKNCDAVNPCAAPPPALGHLGSPASKGANS
jgi:hypothetical protein